MCYLEILGVQMNELVRGDFEWFLPDKEGALLEWEEKNKGTFGDQ